MFAWIGFRQVGLVLCPAAPLRRQQQVHAASHGRASRPTRSSASRSTATRRLALGFVVSFRSFLMGFVSGISKYVGMIGSSRLGSRSFSCHLHRWHPTRRARSDGEYIGRIYDEVKDSVRFTSCVRTPTASLRAHRSTRNTLPPETLSASGSPRTLRLPLPADLARVVLATAVYVCRVTCTRPRLRRRQLPGSLDALRHGQQLGRDVFLDQPPGWYLLLVAVSYPFGNWSGHPHGPVAISLLGLIAAWAAAGWLAGPLAGLAAAGVWESHRRSRASPRGRVGSSVDSPRPGAIAIALDAYRRPFPRRGWPSLPSRPRGLPPRSSFPVVGSTAARCTRLALPRRSFRRRRLPPPVAGAAALCAGLLVGPIATRCTRSGKESLVRTHMRAGTPARLGSRTCTPR